MGNFLDTKSTKIDFYEVTDPAGVAVWGGNDSSEAIIFFRQAIGSRLFVSVWESDEEDARMIGVPIEITKLITTTIADSLERVQQWR
jgi:hypothetical protein